MFIAYPLNERYDFVIWRLLFRMIGLTGANDDIYHAGKTAAAFAAHFHGVINLAWRYELPFIHVEKVGDDLFDIL